VVRREYLKGEGLAAASSPGDGGVLGGGCSMQVGIERRMRRPEEIEMGRGSEREMGLDWISNPSFIQGLQNLLSLSGVENDKYFWSKI
jgi:hypothetical protein